MLKLFAKKEEHNLKTKLSRSKSIVSFENSFFKPSGLQIYITPNVLGERKQMYFPDNMCCTIRDTTFSRNFFQPLVSEIKNGLTIMAIYIYGYILDSLAKK